METSQQPIATALLVVDDEEQVRLILRRQLERLGYDVTLAADGSSALAELAVVPQRYAAVLIDLTLPEMDGITLAHEIAGRNPSLPILLMSGFHATDLHAQIADVAVAGFLQKPFTLADLRTILDRVLSGSNQ